MKLLRTWIVAMTAIAAVLAQSTPAQQEQHYREILQSDPENRAASYDLGRAILAQHDQSRQEEALFHLTRAAYHDGPGALPPDLRESVRSFVRRTLTTYLQTRDVPADYISATQRSPFPTAEDLVRLERLKPPPIVEPTETEFRTQDPQKFLWFAVKRELISQHGEAYFKSDLLDMALPNLRGRIVSAVQRGRRITELHLAILDDSTPEVALIVKGSKTRLVPGQVIELDEAVGKKFQPEPFLLTCEVAAANVTLHP